MKNIGNTEMLEKFIEKNELTFTDGRRNKDALTLCGYALFKDCTLDDVKLALAGSGKTDDRSVKEVETVYSYGEQNSYGSWWENVNVVDHKIVSAK